MSKPDDSPPMDLPETDNPPDTAAKERVVEPIVKIETGADGQVAPAVSSSPLQQPAPAIELTAGSSVKGTSAPPEGFSSHVQKVESDSAQTSVGEAQGEIESICNEIRHRHQALAKVSRRSLELAIELGGLLTSMKERLRHGKWYRFLEDAELGTRSAQNYMRLYERREEVRTKSALSADLTITGSLKALQPPKPKPDPIPSGNKTNKGEIVLLPKKGSEILNQANDIMGSKPPVVSRGEVGHSEGQKTIAEESSSTTQDESPVVTEGDNGQDVPPCDCPQQGAPTCEIAVGTSVAGDVEGFLFADGTRWPSDPADDGFIPFRWTQGQIKLLKENNNRIAAELRWSLSTLHLAETFLVELARTVNRVSGTSNASGEETMAALNEVMNQLWNLTRPSVAVTNERKRVATPAASQDKSAHSNSA